MTEPDPARELLAFPETSRGPDGTIMLTPISLDEAAEMFAAMIDGGRKQESVIELDYSGADELIAFSASRGLVLISLFEELALRTEPGHRASPIQSDGELSRLAGEAAAHLRAGY